MSAFDPSLPHGAQIVARLDEIGALERLFVESLRLWLAGPNCQAAVWNTLAVRLRPAPARRALGAFETYLETVAVVLERRLHHHRVGCLCLGRDEATLAAVMRLAGEGDLAAASAEAARLVRPNGVPGVVGAAAQLGCLLHPALAGETTPRRRLH